MSSRRHKNPSKSSHGSFRQYAALIQTSLLLTAQLWGVSQDRLPNFGTPFRGSKMDGCQKDGPFLGPYYNTAPNI